MKALVTGVEGFVGSYLVKQLQEEGFSVVGTYKSQKPVLDIPLFSMDILDLDSVKKIFLEEMPDKIFHLAGISDVRWSFDHSDITKQVNTQGTKNILDAMTSCCPKSHLTFISSSEVYGYPKQLPLTEESSLDPVNPYGESKKEAEEVIQTYQNNGLSVAVMRSFTHIGPNQSPNFVCSSFSKQIVAIEKGLQEKLFVGNLEAKRDFTDVRDIVKGYVLASKNNLEGTFNICSGKSHSIQSILDTLTSLSESNILVEKDPERMRPSDVPEFRGSYQKLQEQTRWIPLIPLSQTLQEILDYWRENS